MILHRIRRKLYKMTHPAVAEVWMLHRVVSHRSEMPRERALEVTPDWLQQRIEQHLAQGVHFLSPDELIATIQAAKQAKNQKIKHPPYISLTFDEGCRETLTHVVPLFQRLQIPFTLFVTTGLVAGEKPIDWYHCQPDMMDWNELIELSRNPLCTIGAHTINHPHLCQLNPEAVRQEVGQSRLILEERLRQPIRYFSYPYGERNATVKCQVRQCGYTAAFEAWGGAVRTGADLFDMPRIPIIQ